MKQTILSIIKKITALAPKDPRIERMRSFVLREKVGFTTVKHPVQVADHKEELDIRFVIPEGYGEFAETHEETTLAFAKRHSLYQENWATLIASRFAFFTAAVHPMETETANKATSEYDMTLFDHDDMIDTGDKAVVSKKLRAINQELIDVWDGKALKPGCSSRTEAVKEIYDKYVVPQASHHKIPLDFHRESLRGYLQATENELLSGTAVRESNYILNRQHSGGIRHAIAFQCLMEGIDVGALIKQDLLFENLLIETANAAGILNDVISPDNEYKDFAAEVDREQQEKPQPGSREQKIKEKINCNLVLIKYKQGKDFHTALTESLDVYHEKLDSFYAIKQQVFEKYDNGKGLSDDAIRFLYILESWNSGHPVWALNSRRYAKTGGITTEIARSFIGKLKAED